MTDSLLRARQMTEVAEKMAAGFGIKITVAVVDGGGHLVAFSRMEGVQFSSVTMAPAKAYTAVAWKRPSKNLYDASQPGGVGYGLQALDRRYVFAGGGMPILEDGVVVGGIGISGGTADQDQQMAEAAVAAVDNAQKPPSNVAVN